MPWAVAMGSRGKVPRHAPGRCRSHVTAVLATTVWATLAAIVATRCFISGSPSASGARGQRQATSGPPCTVQGSTGPGSSNSDNLVLLDKPDSSIDVKEQEFWRLINSQGVEEVLIDSWTGRELVARLSNGSSMSFTGESEVEDMRDRLIKSGVPIQYPRGDSLSVEESLDKANYTSEGAVAGGIFAALAVGIADSLLEIGGAAFLTGAEIEGQAAYEKKGPLEVVGEDFDLFNRDLRFLERAAERAEKAAEVDFQAAEGLVAKETIQIENWFTNAIASGSQWIEACSRGLIKYHAEGLGGLIEDSFMGLLVAVSVYSLYQMAFLRRKSNSWSGLAHTATGAMQIVTVLYAIAEERCLRESPGPVWAVFTFAVFMVNNITMWPLLKYFKGTEVQRVLFKLAYSFIISFQGIHAIAWSIKYEWLYWIVMPFWFYSVKKLAESSDNIFALLPDGTIPIEGLQEAARRRVKGIKNDTPTLVYSILNFGGAVFDNLYMAVYTWRGPAGFWGWSLDNIPGVNDHLRTGLVKPAFGSLTISVLVFLATLVYRKKVDKNTALALNVVLASIGPWLILYYHKLVDFSEPWQPEIMGEWGSTPYLISHISDLSALLAVPLAFIGLKALSVGTITPAVAEVLPEATIVETTGEAVADIASRAGDITQTIR